MPADPQLEEAVEPVIWGDVWRYHDLCPTIVAVARPARMNNGGKFT